MTQSLTARPFYQEAVDNIKIHPKYTSGVIVGIALSTLAILALSGIIGGPAILQPMGFFAFVIAVPTVAYFIYKINIDSCHLPCGLQLKDFTKTTGDCLFDNALAQIDDEMTLLELRQGVAEYMRNHADQFKEHFNNKERLQFGNGKRIRCRSWEQYLGYIAQPTVWGSPEEVRAIAVFLDRPVALITPHFQQVYNETSTKRPIFLYHMNRNHFVSCTPIKGRDGDEIFQQLAQNSV